MRKIAFIAVNEFVRWGGSEELWSRAAERLARSGVEVRVSAKDWGGPVKELEELRGAGCRIFLRPVPRFGVRLRRKLLLQSNYQRHHMREIGGDADLVVISQGGNFDGWEWMEAARELGLTYAVISQSVSEQWWVGDDEAERLAAGYEGARAAYFVSEANLELSRRQFGTRLERGRVVRNPFNVRYEVRPEWPGGEGEELRLACVARMDPAQKGQDTLMEVLGRRHWRERNVRVTLAGSGRNERLLRRMAERLKLKSVEFAGQVEDIEGLWARHHALVLASRYEGLPLALVEAMLCGRAALVTDVGGNCELVRDGVNGFVAKAATAEFVDEMMNRAWEQRGRLREMGEAAARDVREKVPADPVGEFVRELEGLVVAGASVGAAAAVEKREAASWTEGA